MTNSLKQLCAPSPPPPPPPVQSIILVFILVGLISNAINVVLHAALLAGAKMGFRYVLKTIVWTTVFTLCVCVLFCYGLALYRGAIVAMTISQGLSPAFVLVYMFACGLHKQTWGGWTWEALEDWWPFVKLAIPGVLMIGLEWWSYEIGGLVLGAMSRTQQAIHLNLLNVNAILFLVRIVCYCCLFVCAHCVWTN